VHAEYKIARKEVMTFTDNGANFVKAFTEFAGTESSGIAVPEQTENDDIYEDDVVFLNVVSVLDFNAVSDYCLLPHRRCAAHTLNLVPACDSRTANDENAYKKLSRATFAQCSALWNKASRSTVSADAICEELTTCLVLPNATRWNSFFDSVDKLRQVIDKGPKETLKEVFRDLDIVPHPLNWLSSLNSVWLGSHLPVPYTFYRVRLTCTLRNCCLL
jgi:hypothetical protein